MPFNLLSTDGEIQLSLTTILGKNSGYFDGMVLQDWNPFTAPTFNDRSTPYLWDWGASGGFDTIGTRKLKWTVFITGTTMAQLMAKIQALSYDLSPSATEKELCFQIGSETFTYFGRPRGMEVVRLDTAHFFAWVECRWEALDPRYYSNTTVTVTSSAVNWTLNSLTMAHDSSLETASAPSPWQAVITPNNGTITGLTANSAVQIFNATPTVTYAQTLDQPRELVLDSRKRTAIWRNANDTDPILVDFWMAYTNVWFDLSAWQDPATTLIRFSRTGGTATSITTVLTFRKCNI
jgi:hypothetical protein